MIRRHFLQACAAVMALPWLSRSKAMTSSDRAYVVVHDGAQLKAALNMECPRVIAFGRSGYYDLPDSTLRTGRYATAKGSVVPAFEESHR